MRAKIIDGKLLARQIRDEIALKVSRLKDVGLLPGLAVILVGENPASISYVTAKERDCKLTGIKSYDIRFPMQVSQEQLVDKIRQLNRESAINGILVQLPLPEHINSEEVIREIAVDKDVDGFHPENVGRLLLNLPGFIPCTPLGIIKMLELSGVSLAGADVVIIGRSRIVGAPLAALMMRKAPGGNATVTVCHSNTRDIEKKTLKADILIVAMGKPEAVTARMIREGAVVIDVGINRIQLSSGRYKLVGDVDFDSAAEVAGAITTVPGGVGPLTRAMLLWNTLQAVEQKFGLIMHVGQEM